jgi:hypothetical protein
MEAAPQPATAGMTWTQSGRGKQRSALIASLAHICEAEWKPENARRRAGNSTTSSTPAIL